MTRAVGHGNNDAHTARKEQKNLKYGYMRAKTRAVAAAAGAALVVVPLTGAAAAALVTTEDDAAITTLGAAQRADYANDIAEIPAVTSTEESATFTIDTATVDVELPPPPPEPEPVATTRTSSGTSAGASTTSNSTGYTQPSGDVQAAIAGSAVIAEAAKYVGVPYVSGGSSPSGFDCSGFVSYVYGQLGISLPRSSSAYWGVGVTVTDPQPGDIIVTSGHLGLYAGPNLQIDAPRPGKTIQFRPIWQSNPTFKRVVG